MSDLAGVAATFSDLKLIRGRKVAQLVFEVPIEGAKSAIDALGMPNATGETWCAIARLNSKPQTQLSTASTPGGTVTGSERAVPPAAKPKRRWDELQPSAQVSIRLDEPEFTIFLEATAATALDTLRKRLNVISRKDLNSDPQAAQRWHILDEEYVYWLRQQR